MPTFSKVEFGVRLRKRRIAAGFLKQQDLADAIGVTNASISFYESGSRLPDAETLSKITQSLNCTADYLTQREDAPTHPLADIVQETGLSHEAISKLVSANQNPQFSVIGQCSDVGKDNFMARFLSELICSEELNDILNLFISGYWFNDRIESMKYTTAEKSTSCDDIILKTVLNFHNTESFAAFKNDLYLVAARQKAMDALGKFFDNFVKNSPFAESGIEIDF